jgi:hypothetical protein
VVIRDKNYWKGVDKQGGIENFNARSFFKKNRIKIKVSSALKKKKSNSNSRSPSVNSIKSR